MKGDDSQFWPLIVSSPTAVLAHSTSLLVSVIMAIFLEKFICYGKEGTE